MALTTTTREELAQVLNLLGGVQAFPTTPPVPPIPGIVIHPDDPYLDVDRLGSRLTYTVNLTITAITQATDINTSLKNAEELVDKVLGQLPAGYLVNRVNAPQLTDMGAQGSAYTTDIAVSAHVTTPSGGTP
jgi:hypothetical protein